VTRRVAVEADGGSRGNPGPAGYGAVVLDAVSGELLAERSRAIGVATNNVAEYSGLIAGLEAALALGADEVEVRMDSQLVVQQMTGRWQIKHPSMKPLAERAATLAGKFAKVTYTWMPRAANVRADKLANLAMDGAPVNRDVVPGSTAEAGRTGAVAAAPVAGGWSAPAAEPTAMLLVRHGASLLSPEKRFSGRGDVPLSPAGSEQARRVAARLAGREGVVAVVSSPLRRAVRTAEAIAAGVDLSVTVDPDLIETDFGRWEGLTFAEAREQWPDELAAWLASPDAAPPGGESFAATAERVERARLRILAGHPAGTVIVVSHVGPVKTLLRIALGAPPETMFRMQIDTASVSEIDWYADGPANVRLVNDTHHLTGMP
jgi:probable phosphoglycerate mutase